MNAVNLNLLPEGLRVSKSVASVLKIVRPLNVILLGIFLAGALGMTVFFVFSSVTLKNLTTKNNSLIREIEQLGSAQQQVVLIKDKLDKVKKILTLPNASADLRVILPYIDKVAQGSEVTELDINTQSANLTLTFRTNNDLSLFMNSISNQTPFSKVVLNSFSYNPGAGYLVGITVVRGENR